MNHELQTRNYERKKVCIIMKAKIKRNAGSNMPINKYKTFIFSGLLATALCSGICQAGQNQSAAKSKFDAVILYTNDVHCFVDETIGYSGLVAYKKEMLQKTPYVTLVDCGDHLQGNAMGSISKGEFIVDIMNKVRYDFATIGNHEFDYGLPVLAQRINNSKTTYLNCNASYNGSQENPFAKTIPYSMKRYGIDKIAFIGVVTPKSIGSSNPKHFQEDDRIVVDLKGGNNAQDLWDTVQNTVNECRSKGAKYVVVLAHLGISDSMLPFTSKKLIAATTGIDVVLDGHSHSVIPCEKIANKEGREVTLTSTGTALERIGKLTISADGISSELISGYSNKDERTTAFIENIKASLGEEMNRIVGVSDTHLSINDENGVRLVRNRETGIGNWFTDAMAYTAKTEIAITNGGGIRSDLKAGEIAHKDILSVHTFNNQLYILRLSGQQLLDTLEFSYRFIEKESSKDGSAVGESGSFMQVSGIKLTIDTSIPFDGKNPEQHRVKDVMVKVNGEYEPLELSKNYIIAAPKFLVSEKTPENIAKGRITEDNVIDRLGVLPEALSLYFQHLGGKLSKYATPEGRITVK